MNIHFPLKRQALAGALALTLVAACLPAPQPTATPNLTPAPIVLPTTVSVPTQNLVPTLAASQQPTVATPAPTATFTTAVSDFSKLPDPLDGWQQGDRSVPITITEYGDFQ